MIFLFGILVAAGSLFAAVLHLHQEARHFWDFVAFACVTGGTTAVALMTFPWQYHQQILQSLKKLMLSKSSSDGLVVQKSIEFIQKMQGGAHQPNDEALSLANATLRDGAELIGLGFSRQRIQEILEERIHQSYERSLKISTAMRSLAKYPPAFGLAGTVLGLVTLMRNVSEGADAKQTGLTMAVALMATFYGLLTANLIINPAGENMAKAANIERKQAAIALHAVLLFLDGASLLEAQEILNSYVVKNQRINVTALPEAA